MIFQDPAEAARLLAEALKTYRGKKPLVLAIPRGAVPMAKIIANKLQGEVDIVMTRKLQAPRNLEYAIGAVDESGWTYLAASGERAGATREYIAREVAAEQETMRLRRAQGDDAPAPSTIYAGARASRSGRSHRDCGR